MDALRTVSTRRTPQSQKAPDRPEQVFNNAGGAVFEVSDVTRLRRFLVLGSEKSFYQNAAKLTRENADVVFRMAEKDPETLLSEIVSISQGGRAPKQNQAIFALAIAASFGDTEHRRAALAALPLVCRTGTHLFLFTGYVEQFRGWGRGLKRAVANWYLDKPVGDVTYQSVKYRSREQWTHRDLLRLSHPRTAETDRNALFRWITAGDVGEHTPRLIEGFLKAQETGADVPALIRDYRLSWEMVPDDALGRTETWDALLDNGIPATALMRQLPRLTKIGMFPTMGGRTAEAAALLSDSDRLKKARVHPVNVLVAQRTYASGRGFNSRSTWTPNRKIIDALDAGFYAAFGAVESSGKRTLLALDVSGSMTAPISGTPLSAREASAALALVQMSTEPDAGIVGFTSGGRRTYNSYRNSAVLTPLSISPRQRLDDAIRSVSGLPFGGTDCALPMLVAAQQKLAVDSFVIYTDNETWYGDVHPYQALREYREKMGIDARLIVVGMTATKFSIADPRDGGMLDVAGFDSAVPNMISDFSRGDF